jgi:hypothetical protein
MKVGGRVLCAVLIMLSASIAKCSLSQRAMAAKTGAMLAEADGKMLTEVFGDIDAICLVPEYQSVEDFIEPFGFKVKRNRYIGELETGLVVLGGSKEDFFLLTTSQGGSYVGSDCFDPGRHKFKVETLVHPSSGTPYQKLSIVKIR